MIKNTALLFVLFFYHVSYSQVADEKSIFELYQDTLSELSNKTFDSKKEATRISYNQKLLETLERALQKENSYKYPFDSLTGIARLVSPDNKFRIFNWNLPFDDESHQYFGIIQVYNKKNNHSELFQLTDKSAEIKSAESHFGDYTKWYGMLYYQIIPVTYKKKKHYVLLGWDGNNKISRKKIVDILSFNSKGEPLFGDNVFENLKGSPKRMIIEYNSEAVVSLKFNQNNSMIIFDHLAPPLPSLEGHYQFYGPDFTYDALKLRKGKWFYQENISPKNDKNNRDKLYKNPKQKDKVAPNQLFNFSNK